MGGHGGLNILPQKRWHLYREDNRLKVARDEADDRRRKDDEERQRRTLQLDVKLGRLRARAVEAGLDEEQPSHNDDPPESTSVESTNEAPTDFAKLPAEFGPTERRRGNKRKPISPDAPFHSRRRTGDEGIPGNVSYHVNLFPEEEKQLKKAETAHAKYLAEVGHEATDISDFDRIISQSSSPWYLQPKRMEQDSRSCDATGHNLSLHSMGGSPSYIQRQGVLSGTRTSSRHCHISDSDGRRLSTSSHPSSNHQSYRKSKQRTTSERGRSSSTCTTISSGDDRGRRKHSDRHRRGSKKENLLHKSETKHERRIRKQAEHEAHIAKLRSERIAREREATTIRQTRR